MTAPIVIVGAGQAGLQIAESLRTEGFAGEIVLIGNERLSPYQRPPLSKAWLAGEAADDRLILRGPDTLVAKGIDLRLGLNVRRIDPAAQRVFFADGSDLAYSGLALATGARARRPVVPGGDLSGVCVLRDIADAKEISRRLDDAENVVVIGGGFIGLEVAAAARKKGRAVTLIEAQDRLMARAVTRPVSKFFADLHFTRGVELHFGQQVAAVHGDGCVQSVVTADGWSLRADLVVFGIGAIANDQLATEAGLETLGGVVVDACGRTSRPGIVAAGDCAVVRRADGRLLRLESVQNAVELGKAAAAALLGREKPFVAAPWFWSDQYDVKLQMAGSSEGADLSIARAAAENAFSLFSYRAGKLIAVESINRPGEHLLARKLLDAGLSPDPARAGDPACDLKSLLR